jgi:hypothetical protein
MLEKTITQNNKVRASTQYPIIAGVDKDNVPQLLKVKADGTIDMGGVTMPVWETFEVQFYGSTNNIHYVIFKVQSNEVGRWTFTYRNGALVDDDDIATGGFTTP